MASSYIEMYQDKVEHLLSLGMSKRKIAKQLDIPKSSLSDWLRTKNLASCYEVEREKPVPHAQQQVVKIQTTKVLSKSAKGHTHIVIPDTQCKPGIDMDYLRWYGEYIASKMPDVIVHLGDHADLPSLSSYDKGKKSAEGKRLIKDIEAAIEGMNLFLAPIKAVQDNQMRVFGKVHYKPKMVLTLGNHCSRVMRHVEANPELEGFLSYDSLRYKEMGWEVYDYLEPVVVDGVTYIHYFPNPFTGKPYGGSALNMLQKVGCSFTQGHKQTLDVATRTMHNGQQQWAIIAGACLTPDHKVLTDDLRYVPLGEIKEGQKLISFEEYSDGEKRSRRWKTGTVLATKIEKDDVYEVTLESGKKFKVTKDHRWLTKCGSAYLWKETSQMRKGTCVPKLLDEWELINTFNAGWLSGMYDGEGCLHQRKTTGGNCFQLGITQKEGPTLERVKKELSEVVGVGNTTHTQDKRDCTTLRIKGGVRNMLKVLGSLRPSRLLPKLNPDNMGSICNKDGLNDKVVSIVNIGEQDVVRIDIDSKTMIVEGYGHHNCYPHDEGYKGYTGNKHWRGIIVKHEVKDGSYDPLFVSMEYLRERYSHK